MPAPVERSVTWSEGGRPVSTRFYRASRERSVAATLVLAHGAGAGLTHPFMVAFGEYLSARGVDVVTFNFPYMEAGRRVPDPAAILESCYLGVLGHVRRWKGLDAQPLLLGGKSLGGRMASHVAAYHAERAAPLSGLVFLGYPLHPPQRPQQRRDAHLGAIDVPMLFVQGSRDPFGTPDELRSLCASLRAPADLVFVEEGDHSLVVPRRLGVSREEVLTAAADSIAGWVRARPSLPSDRP
jgi:predicted alpha/beta-hydrolase family hydrolase